MSSIFSHNLSAMFRDRAYASFGRGGSLKVAAAFAVGVAVTALLLKPVPEEARAAWAGGSSGVDVQAVQKDVALRVAAHKKRKAVQTAAAEKILASGTPAADKRADRTAALSADVAAQTAQTQAARSRTEQVQEPAAVAAQVADAGVAVPMPAPRPSAADMARMQAAHRAAAAEKKRIARARDERTMHAENYPAPQAYRISDGRMVRVYRRDPRLPPQDRYASRATNPISGLLGLFGVTD
ncbi:MAG: hypothetical protein AB7O60_03840 [Variibacter sp.]